MQSKSRATLSHQLQINGHQERRLKNIDPDGAYVCKKSLQADWDDVAKKLVQAFSNSKDSTKKETSFLSGPWMGPLSSFNDRNNETTISSGNLVFFALYRSWRIPFRIIKYVGQPRNGVAYSKLQIR